MPRRREAAMQQIGQLPPMTQEQDVRTAQTPPCANAPNGSAKQDGTAHPPKQQTPPNEQGHALSGELLETLRRECLERSVVTRVARLPRVIDKTGVTVGEESRVASSASATSKAERSHVRSPSRAQSLYHSQRQHHQQEQHVKLPLTAKLESRRRGSAEQELKHSRSPSEQPQRPKTEPPSPPPLQSAAQHSQQQQPRTRSEREARHSERAMVCKKEEHVERSGVAKCNYVLSDNYENLSGDESPASRSLELEASTVDRKAIELFLPLVDAVEEHRQNEGSAPAAEEQNVASDDYDDLPEEGSLVIDDGGVDGEISASGSASAASAAGSDQGVSGSRWPLRSSSSLRPDSPAESSGSPPTAGGEFTGASRSRSFDDCSDSSSKWLSPKDQKNKKSKMALLRKAASTDSAMRPDDTGTTPPPLAPARGISPPTRKMGKRSTSRPAMPPSTRQSGSCDQEDRVGARAGIAARPGDDQVDGAPPTSQQRNGLRKRSRWKTAASQEDEDPGGADSGSTIDYQLSSDEESSKGTGPSDEPTPPPPVLPPPPQPSHLSGASGKKQRKNSEDHHRRTGGEQHGDESRYKRLAQELPGFNWLEQKIMGHGGANFADGPPMSKHVSREAPAVTASAPEKTEQKGTAPVPEPKRVYPPDTDILRRSMSMSEIQGDCCEEDDIDEAPVTEAAAMAEPEVEKIYGDEPPPELVQPEIPRQILVTALPDTYHTDPRLSQVITSTALIRPQYPMEVHMANTNAMLEMPLSAPGLTSAPHLAAVSRNMHVVETEPRSSSKSQAEAISQGRTAPEDQSSDSDVLYLGVSRKSVSPRPEHTGRERRTSTLSEGSRVPETSKSVDGNIGHSALSEKPRSSGPEPINLSDAARRGEPYGAPPREHYSFFQPQAFVMADHQRWLEERRYQEMMNARGPLMQPRHLLPPPQTPLELSQRRLSGGAQMLPNRLEAQQQYRAAPAPERQSTLRQAPPSQQGPSPHQAPPPHQPSPSHQSQLSQQTPHQAQLAQQGAQSHQPPPSHQSQFAHQVAQPHQLSSTHQAQMLHQAQLSHQVPLSRQTQQLHQTPPFYPMPRAHQAQPTSQPFQPLPALTRDTSPRSGRPDFYPAQQRYKTVDQAYAVSPHAQQMSTYGGPPPPKRSPEPATKSGPPSAGNAYMKDGKADSMYKEPPMSRPGPVPLQQAPVNAKPPSSSPHGQHPESVGNSSQANSLKTEMEMLKGELKYLDALAAQKEAEYEKVVHTRSEKLKTLNQLEARYKRSLEPPQPYPKEDLRHSLGMEVRQRQSPIAHSEKSSPLQDDSKSAPRQRSGSSGGSGQQKPSPPALSSPLSKTSPAHQPVPGLIPYPMSHPQQTRQPLPQHASIPISMPLIGPGMFNMRNMELRDFGPMMAQQHGTPMVPGYGRPYYPLERAKHPTLHPMEAPKPPVKRKYSPATAGLPQANGDMRVVSSQRAVPPGHRQREPEKVTAPLSQEHRQWLQTVKSRETAGEPPGYPAGVQSAFQSYNFFPSRRMLPEDLPLNPAMTNAAWSNYAEGLHEQYAFHMAKQSMYPSHPAWGGLEKQQRSCEPAGAAMLGRELPAKRLSREEPVMHHMAKERLATMRPGEKPAAHAASLGGQAAPHEQALPSQPTQPSQSTQSKNNTCVMCGQHAQFMCSGCQNVWYCGPNCQRSHWVNHSNVCMGTSVRAPHP